MNAEEFRDFHETLIQDAGDLLFLKMKDYASQEDQLSNFRGAAKALHTSPMMVWAVYFHKHVCAVQNYAATGRVESEHIRERFKDLMNYAVIGAALAHEADRGKCTVDVGRPGQIIPMTKAELNQHLQDAAVSVEAPLKKLYEAPDLK